MISTASINAKQSVRPTFSCIRCAERKVKCDRQKPCNGCVKHNVDCIYNATKPPRTKQKRIKVQVLADRLSQYEALLAKHGIDRHELSILDRNETRLETSRTGPAPLEGNQSYSPPITGTSAGQYSVTHTQTHSEFVENSLWRRVFEESQESGMNMEDSESSSDLDELEHEYDYVLGIRPKVKEDRHFPPLETMEQLWDVFVENFDPLTKIVHVPTLRPAFEKAVRNITTIPRNFEALMFSIFSAAVLTLKDHDCQQRFSQTRRRMLAEYTTATEAALARAKFMATTSLVVLQALVIHLFAVRDNYEPRAMWTLTGVAVRIAEGMGLDRDGSFLGRSPFDTEIRRRVWWQLKSHDFRAAELCGLAKFRDIATGTESTLFPSNINDNDLHPNMATIEAVTAGLTDAAFVAYKFEMTKFAASRIANFRRLGKDPSQWNLDDPDVDKAETTSAAQTLQETLETKYLRYCDPSHPLHLMLLLVGRYALNIVKFLTHHPRRWATMEHVPQSERTMIWDGSIKLLEQYNMMQSNPLVERFAWHAPYFQQWHAFIHVLDTLRAEPLMPDAPKAWRLVKSIYESTPGLGSDFKKPIHVAIGNLCLKAHIAREAALLKSKCNVPPTPTFISKLRQRQVIAHEKQQARNAKVDQTQGQPTHGMHSGLLPRAMNCYEGEQTASDQPDHGDNYESDPYHHFDVFENSQNDAFYMDAEFFFPDNNNMADHALEPINWEQWDAWLADSNLGLNSGRVP